MYGQRSCLDGGGVLYPCRSGEIEATVEMFSQPFVDEYGKNKVRAAMQDATKEVVEKGGIADLQILEEDTIGEISEVQVKIVYGNDEEETETINLVVEDGTWKLQPEK